MGEEDDSRAGLTPLGRGLAGEEPTTLLIAGSSSSLVGKTPLDTVAVSHGEGVKDDRSSVAVSCFTSSSSASGHSCYTMMSSNAW